MIVSNWKMFSWFSNKNEWRDVFLDLGFLFLQLQHYHHELFQYLWQQFASCFSSIEFEFNPIKLKFHSIQFTKSIHLSINWSSLVMCNSVNPSLGKKNGKMEKF